MKCSFSPNGQNEKGAKNKESKMKEVNLVINGASRQFVVHSKRVLLDLLRERSHPSRSGPIQRAT